MSFDPFLKAVGTGPKGNRDLTQDEMHQAMMMILQGQVSPEVIGAFLIALRIKIESDDELKGTHSALKTMLSPQLALPDSIELSYPFDGKKKHPILLPLIAKACPDLDIIVSIDSDLRPKGTTLLELSQHKLLPDNIHLQDRSEFLLWLSSLNSLRNNLKLRTIFNTVEKLLNPVQSSYAVIGAHHTPYFKKYQELFGSSYERLIILQGDEGSSEVVKKAKLIIVDQGKEVEKMTLDPKDFDIDPLAFESFDTAASRIEILKNPDKNIQNLTLLNAKILSLAAKKISVLS